MQGLESLANRVCVLQCEALSLVGDTQCTLDTVKFTFMLWDHVACGVRMGCVQDGGGGLLFVVSYDGVGAEKRLFMGVPWIECTGCGRTLAAASTVDSFLQQIHSSDCLQTDVVFDGKLAVDKTLSLHLQFGCDIGNKSMLLVKDVAECDNVLLVIDLFK